MIIIITARGSVRVKKKKNRAKRKKSDINTRIGAFIIRDESL